MTANWRVRYLANVLTALDVDGELPPREALFSSILQKRLDLSDEQSAEALLVARQDPPEIYLHDEVITNGRNLVDMLLAKRRAGDRKSWLETKGDLAEL